MVPRYYKQAALYHHGILGQKWGVRNGPPYPLGAKAHSASERKAEWRKSLDKPAGGIDRRGRKRYTSYKTSGRKLSKVVKFGAVATVAALATYGAYKAGYFNDLKPVGMAAARKILSEFGTRPLTSEFKVGDFKFTPPKSSGTSKAKHPPIIRDPKTGFKLIKESTEDSLKHANPSRGTASGANNCSYCTVAGFLRTKGYDVTAKTTGGEMQNLGGVLEDCFKGVKVYNGSAIKFGKSPDDAAQMLKKKFGDNASGAVGVTVRGGGSRGHAFSWEIKNGAVQFLDFQQGSSGESVEKYWSFIDRTGELTFARLDGLEINLDNINKYVDGH